jgi:hypothetical protein
MVLRFQSRESVLEVFGSLSLCEQQLLQLLSLLRGCGQLARQGLVRKLQMCDGVGKILPLGIQSDGGQQTK